ncbi:MAG: hypothetical protein H8E34_01875 [Bacteroidetes bacterium]|nr:hypothetical protein [Bacteroidota bacterium]MBL6944125.1 hypothetical protein [Bacteroidales bacterium]
MKNIISAILLISGLIIIKGCSTDFDMYAEYKDITIIYGMADISEDTTWVKITKAYTGPGNALLIAQNPDSNNYPYKLSAKLVGKKNGNELEPLILDTLTIHNKAVTEIIINENGDTIIINPFYSPNQVVYYAVGNLDKDAEYTLSINKTDEILTASTQLVDNFNISKPINRIAFSPTFDGSIEWGSAKNGKRYEVSLRFNYQELAPGYADTLRKSVNWFLGVRSSKTANGGESLEVGYSGPGFFSLIQSELESIPNVERWVDDVDITIACGSQVLATYLDINSGGGNLLEEVPIYSNIVGGSGVFASRHTIMKSILVSSTTERDLIEDYDLGFKFKSK